jgi:two-component system, LytTR family, response regulator
MKIKTCIIVEDEPLAQERLKDYIEKVPGLKLVNVLDNGTDALAFLQQQVVDLIFLDIHMEGISGIRLLEEFDIKSQVIITTAYHEFAIKGFDLNVTDYLLKPYDFERFRQAIEKAEAQTRKNELPQEKPYVYIKTEYRLEKIMFADIIFIEGMRDYRKIHTKSKPIMTLQTFRDFEKEIPVNILCRVHKSYMVAIDKIDSIEKNEIRIGEKFIPISDTYRQAFYEIITQPKN